MFVKFVAKKEEILQKNSSVQVQVFIRNNFAEPKLQKKLQKFAEKFFEEVFGETQMNFEIIFNFRCVSIASCDIQNQFKSKVLNAFKDGLNKFAADNSNDAKGI